MGIVKWYKIKLKEQYVLWRKKKEEDELKGTKRKISNTKVQESI